MSRSADNHTILREEGSYYVVEAEDGGRQEVGRYVLYRTGGAYRLAYCACKGGLPLGRGASLLPALAPPAVPP